MEDEDITQETVREYVRKALSEAGFAHDDIDNIMAARVAANGLLGPVEPEIAHTMSDVNFREELRHRGYDDEQIERICEAWTDGGLSALLAWIYS